MKAEINEIVGLIKEQQHFEATTTDGAFTVKINKYVPYCCTAIHAGSRLRPELLPKIALDEYQRWYEEDPYTNDFILSMPITIIVHDSRYEYDLNRPALQCIYDVAWGKTVWRKKLKAKDIKMSRQKHTNYYKVIHALISKLEELWGGCLVFDIHSYNYKRIDKETPLFNIGTERIDIEKYSEAVSFWQKELQAISLPHMTTQSMQNEVFYGRGFNLEYISEHFTGTLVLATEIKKVYCDENTGDIYPEIIGLLQQQLKKAIINTANYFSQDLVSWQHRAPAKLLGSAVEKELLKIDRNLHHLLKSFELLAMVNPVNTQTEKNRFLKNKYSVVPSFRYHPIKINVFDLKHQLLSLPIHKIQDISIRNLYEATINSYFDKIDMISKLGSRTFLYNSLRYFGRPSKIDIQNAKYLLHLPEIPGEIKKEPILDVQTAMKMFGECLQSYGIKAKIEASSKVISQIMVLNSKRSILFQPQAKFRRKELQALMEHEIGVHMLTIMNSFQQQLKIFHIGLPINTLTQEGLAILAEYLSGNITLRRLKKFALRVIVVDMMCNGASFIDCFNHLRHEYDINANDAFTIVTRIFRGGGFTKDYLYLRGFVKVFKFWKDQHEITPLFIGKTSLDFISTIDEMIAREMISAPTYIPQSFLNVNTANNNPIYTYILMGLK